MPLGIERSQQAPTARNPSSCALRVRRVDLGQHLQLVGRCVHLESATPPGSTALASSPRVTFITPSRSPPWSWFVSIVAANSEFGSCDTSYPSPSLQRCHALPCTASGTRSLTGARFGLAESPPSPCESPGDAMLKAPRRSPESPLMHRTQRVCRS